MKVFKKIEIQIIPQIIYQMDQVQNKSKIDLITDIEYLYSMACKIRSKSQSIIIQYNLILDKLTSLAYLPFTSPEEQSSFKKFLSRFKEKGCQLQQIISQNKSTVAEFIKQQKQRADQEQFLLQDDIKQIREGILKMWEQVIKIGKVQQKVFQSIIRSSPNNKEQKKEIISQKMVQKLNKQYQQSIQKIEHFKGENQSLKEIAVQFQAKNKSVCSKMQKMEQKYQKEKILYLKEQATLINNKSDMQKQIQQYKKKYQQQKNQHFQLSIRYTSKQDEIQNLKKKLNQNQRYTNKVTEQLRQKIKYLNKLKEKYEKRKKDFFKMQQQLNRLKKNVVLQQIKQKQQQQKESNSLDKQQEFSQNGSSIQKVKNLQNTLRNLQIKILGLQNELDMERAQKQYNLNLINQKQNTIYSLSQQIRKLQTKNQLILSNGMKHQVIKQSTQQQCKRKLKRQVKQGKAFLILKLSLQKLYKQFIKTVFSQYVHQDLLKFQKQINNLIKRTQQMQDYLTDHRFSIQQ